MAVIYIAVPSKGVTNGGLTSVFVETMAKLRQKYPQHAFISPMLQDYQLLPYLDEEPIWENWKNQCEQLINACDELWVLMFDGWKKSVHHRDDVYNTSVGVAAELHIASRVLIKKPSNSMLFPICFVDPDSLFT